MIPKAEKRTPLAVSLASGGLAKAWRLALDPELKLVIENLGGTLGNFY